MAEVKKKTTDVKEITAPAFDKSTLMGAKIFKDRKDVLDVVVGDGEEITIEMAQLRIKKFMDREVR